MATVYKTPGVFVEEIPKLPPSVAQVETAIPAFVGFTERADDISPDDLLTRPKRIGSMVEFEQYFGGGPSLVVTEVNIDDANNFRSAKAGTGYYMYDSLRMFYANGGGDCFIVAVGKYGTAVTDTLLNGGTDALMKEDDPTLLVFPDAVVLGDTAFASVQTHALLHCANEARMDRMAILDTKENDAKGAAFRSGIGINSLSYGAAYTPWLKTSLPKKVAFPDVATKIKRNGAAVTLSGLTTDAAIQVQISELDKAYKDKANIIAKSNLLASPSANLRDRYAVLAADYNTPPKSVAKFQALIQYVMSVVVKLDDFLEPGNADLITNAGLKTAVTAAVASTFKTVVTEIVALDKAAKTKFGPPYTPQATAANFTDATWGAGFVAGVAGSGILTGANDDENTDLAVNALNTTFESLVRSYLNLVVNAAAVNASNLDKAVELVLPVYKNILRGVSTSVMNMPPSGAVAGIYAAVDRTRGVWKAPANVSLNNVVAPAETFTKSDLDALNVDATTGKSINAIRAFTGEGIKVYGARTLAGNDNEWRYVNIRRFFIMAEESCKKASERFVFEPNDANTWIKVQGMIENYLTVLWRQGALQGAKPEHAFYVAIGLGKTMTPLDILEGRMIVEIGMAVVRPAEYVILRFSHKMAES